jgi:polysaccharide export outer membrane protein
MGIAKGRMTLGSKGVLRLPVLGLHGLMWLVLTSCIGVAQTPPQAPPQTAPQTPPQTAQQQPPAQTSPTPDKPADPKASDAPSAKDTKPGADSNQDDKDKDKKDGAAKPDAKKGAAFSTEMPKDLNDQPEFIVGPGDSIQINVWKEPEVSALVIVRGDCRITLNLIKDVEVCSMTPTQIQNLLTDKLSKFIAAPDVTVSLTGLQSRKVYFIGQGVKRQGGMVLNGPTTIAQALSDAGGLGEYSNGKKVVIQRRDPDGNVTIFVFNYALYLKGKNPKGNILLQPGDTIIVR